MQHPYQIDLGHELYMALWDDPNRPKQLTVEQWAQFLLKHELRPTEEE